MLPVALSVGIAAWLYPLCRFQKSIENTVAKTDEWIDLSLCRALIEAREMSDDLVRT